VYAEPIFRQFERDTGVEVRAVYDSEAVKTVGLANRLLAERSHPQCDVFWGNEEMRSRQLLAQDVFLKTNGWAAFGYRSRRIVINTNYLSVSKAPRSLLELTNQIWRSKVALAYPQFGTTAAQFNALRQLWGDSAWTRWCQGLASNQPLLVDGNSVAVATVGRGDAWIGLTDSDDIAAGQTEGLPIVSLPQDGETLLIPNTIAITKSAPHPLSARRLFDYLQRPAVAAQLVAAHALERAGEPANSGNALKVDWPLLLKDLEATTEKLNAIFLR
jgi:iron(III) transport system substrate-binding protein